MAAPKDATETVPVLGRTWPVTLDVVAKDQTPSVAELNTQKHLTAVTPIVTVNCIPSAVYVDICYCNFAVTVRAFVSWEVILDLVNGFHRM